MKNTWLSEKQRIYLELFFLGVENKMNKMGGDAEIRVVGDIKKVSDYYSNINDIIWRGYYSKEEGDMLNELRIRYIYNSLDYHLAMSLP